MEIQHGAVRVNESKTLVMTKPPVILSVDLGSKYAEIATWGDDTVRGVPCPAVYLRAGQSTLEYNVSDKGKYTVLSFPEYAGYRIWGSPHVSRYTLYLTLVPEDAEE